MASQSSSGKSHDNSRTKNLFGPFMTEEDKRACEAELEHIKLLKKLEVIYSKLKYKDSHYAKIVKESIIGQDEGVDTIVSAIMSNLHQNMMFDYYGEDAKRQSVLLIGPSGCGKTATIRKIAQVIGIPFVVCNATSLTSTGYVGGEVNSVIPDLIENAKGDQDLAERGIIYFDEVDKKKEGSSQNSSGRDINGTAVQEELLKFFDENEIYYNPKKPAFNTRMLTIILGGRFININEFRKTRLEGPRVLGFTQPPLTLEDDPDIDDETYREMYNPYDRTKSKNYTSADVIKFGFLSEFAGRILRIVEYHKLTESMMIDIMLSKDSILQQYYRTFKLKGHELIIDLELYNKLAEAALSEETGARNLESLLIEFLSPAIQDSFNHYGPGIMEYDRYGNYYSVFENPISKTEDTRYIPVEYPERHQKKQP